MKSQHSISRRPHQNMYTYQITLLYCQILVYKDAFQHQSWCIQVAGDTWKNACLTWQLVMQYSSHLQKSAETSWQLCVIVYPYVVHRFAFRTHPLNGLMAPGSAMHLERLWVRLFCQHKSGSLCEWVSMQAYKTSNDRYKPVKVHKITAEKCKQ